MSILEELTNLEAPHNVVEAGTIIQNHLDAGTRPPYGLVQYVERFVRKTQEQNRYGK